MTNEIKVFSNDMFGEVRTTTDEHGNPLFSLRDVCKLLGLQTNKVQQRLYDKGVEYYTTPTNGGLQEVIFINEPNLYRCIFQSRKQEAIKFQDWVFEEVLPSIRNNGGYIVGQKSISQADFNAAVLQEAKILAGTVQRTLDFYKGMCLELQNKLNNL